MGALGKTFSVTAPKVCLLAKLLLSLLLLIIRQLFAATKKLLNQTADTPFPPHGDKFALANDMGSFFIKKISDLRVSLDATENLCSTVNRHSSHCSSSFTAFRRVDMDSLRKLVLRAPTKSCLLDPVPTNILKDCLDELLPILSITINWRLNQDSSLKFRKSRLLHRC